MKVRRLMLEVSLEKENAHRAEMEKVGKLTEQLRTDHKNEKARGIRIEDFMEFKVTLMDEMKAMKEAQ